MYIVKEGAIERIQGRLYSSGWKLFQKGKIRTKNYTAHEFSLQEDEWLFMYTDGYYDQFGGLKNKSMGVNKFKNILCESVKRGNDLNSALKNEFLKWKGNNNQLDDVLVFGFTI